MSLRLLVLAAFFLTSTWLSAASMRPEVVLPREPLAAIPMTVGEWSGVNLPALSKEITAVLGADDYVNRIYSQGQEKHAGLYIGYYGSQREGDTMHSPMNCLPGAGWQPMESTRVSIDVNGQAPISVNRVVIQKGVDRQLVLYWYQSHGRVIASEYWSKVFMVYDAARLNRSDAALVRITTPIRTSPTGVADADARAAEFVQRLFPLLDSYLPS